MTLPEMCFLVFILASILTGAVYEMIDDNERGRDAYNAQAIFTAVESNLRCPYEANNECEYDLEGNHRCFGS